MVMRIVVRTHCGERVRVAGSRTLALPVLGVACCVVLLAGCSSGSHTALPAVSSASPTVTVPPSVTATAATAPAPVATASRVALPVVSATPGGGVAPCPTRALGTTNGGSQGAAGSLYLVIDFRNISGIPCSLYGYPGVALAGGTPVAQLGVAAGHITSPAKTLVMLAPGQVSHVLLKISNASFYAPSACDLAPSTYVQIYPPSQTTPIYFGYTSLACRKPIHLLTVSVVQPGPA